MKSASSRLVLSVAGLTLATMLGACRSLPPAKAGADSALSKVWVADNGDGTYKNPILHADYSDPDIVQAGRDFYLVASSFNCAPGIPVLHSQDLVNWDLIGHVFARQPPEEAFSKPCHGMGVWAPAIRFHNGEFYIYYPDPDRGIYMVKAKNPAGPWSTPLLVKEAKGWIDPCPLWDDDGSAYLINALAASRCGSKSVMLVNRMSPDGTRLIGDPVIVFDGHGKHPTIEGPKLYKRNGYYYISAPAGGVETGWQLILRSKSIYGPYEEKTTLHQGKSIVNGPHQGGWVDLPNGESWFVHFQDKDAYGRIVHLQPMKWVNDWPEMGIDQDGDGIGEPVLIHRKPTVGGTFPKATPPDSDEFNGKTIGRQWQWQANPGLIWAMPAPVYGILRMPNVPLPENCRNLADVPNLLLQKFPANEFTTTTKLAFAPMTEGEKTGLIVFGLDYAHIAVVKQADGLHIVQGVCKNAIKDGAPEKETAGPLVQGNTFYLRVKVAAKAICTFSYSTDGQTFIPIGDPFTATKGKWIGAKIGIFAIRSGTTYETGYADFDWFRLEP
jgi:beta-xylosidase